MKMLTKIKYNVFFSLATFLAIACISNAEAALPNDSIITPTGAHSEQISIISTSGVNSDTDLLHIRQANQAGISVNRFDKFEVKGQALKLGLFRKICG